MNMFDHLLMFASEADAFAAKTLAPWQFEDDKGEINRWDPSQTIPGIEPLTEGGKLSGWWLMVSLPQLNKDIAGMPECVLVMDRDADSAGAAAIKNDADAALKLDTATLDSIVAFSGKPAGSRYEADSFAADKVIAATTEKVAAVKR